VTEPKAYEPEKLTSGVTWKWNKTLSDYPTNESWYLTYYLRKNGATATSFTGSPDGATHSIVVSASTTAGTPQASMTSLRFIRCFRRLLRNH